MTNEAGLEFDPFEGGKSYVDKAIDIGKELAEKDAQIARLTACIADDHSTDAYLVGFEDGKKYISDTMLRDLAYDCVLRVRGSNDVPAFDACVEAEYQAYKACLARMDRSSMAERAAQVLSEPGSVCAIHNDMSIPINRVPTGYRLCVEQMAHTLPSSDRAWMARLITSVQGEDCIKGYGPTPRAAGLAAIAAQHAKYTRLNTRGGALDVFNAWCNSDDARTTKHITELYACREVIRTALTDNARAPVIPELEEAIEDANAGIMTRGNIVKRYIPETSAQALLRAAEAYLELQRGRK